MKGGCVEFGMNTITRICTTALFALVVLLAADGSAGAKEAERPATLAETLDDFIAALETDSVKAPVKFAKDEKSAKALQENWDALKKAHEAHDYRKWLAAAKTVEKEATFTVGGHEYDHLHVEWVKMDGGWKLGGVRLCR